MAANEKISIGMQVADARSCTMRVISTIPKTEPSEEDFRIMMASFTRAGNVNLSAIGALMRMKICRGDRPAISAALLIGAPAFLRMATVACAIGDVKR